MRLPRRWRSITLLALVLIPIVALFTYGTHLGMRSGDVSIRYGWFAVPVAVSEQAYGHRGGYTAYRSVAEVFLGSTTFTDDMLRRAAALPDPAGRGLWFIFVDDKGLVDFVRGAFLLFGRRFAGLYDMFFVTLVLGLVLYVVAFFDRPTRLLAPIFFLLGLYATLFALPLTSELRTLHEPRFLGVLSVISLMHVVFATFDPPGRRSATACTVAQVLVIVFVYHIRSPELWQVLCVVAAAAIAWLVAGRPRWVGLWPAPLLVVGILGVEGYKTFAYHPGYFQGSLSSHIVWHNVYMGFSLHPTLAKQYRIDIDDGVVIEAAERYLRARNDQERWRAIFGQPGHDREGYAHFNWRLYDTVVRDMVRETVTAAPREAAATFLYYKPRLLYRQLAWISGGEIPVADLHLRNHVLADRDARTRRGLYYRPLGGEVLAVLALALLVAGPRDVGEQRRTLQVCGLILAFSLIPGALTYPAVHVIGVVFVVAAMTLYAAAAFGVAVLAAGRAVPAISARARGPAC